MPGEFHARKRHMLCVARSMNSRSLAVIVLVVGGLLGVGCAAQVPSEFDELEESDYTNDERGDAPGSPRYEGVLVPNQPEKTREVPSLLACSRLKSVNYDQPFEFLISLAKGSQVTIESTEHLLQNETYLRTRRRYAGARLMIAPYRPDGFSSSLTNWTPSTISGNKLSLTYRAPKDDVYSVMVAGSPIRNPSAPDACYSRYAIVARASSSAQIACNDNSDCPVPPPQATSRCDLRSPDASGYGACVLTLR